MGKQIAGSDVALRLSTLLQSMHLAPQMMKVIGESRSGGGKADACWALSDPYYCAQTQKVDTLLLCEASPTYLLLLDEPEARPLQHAEKSALILVGRPAICRAFTRPTSLLLFTHDRYFIGAMPMTPSMDSVSSSRGSCELPFREWGHY